VAAELANVIPALDAIGLTINPSKSEIIVLNSSPLDQSSDFDSLLHVLPGARLTSLDSAELLGAPLLPLAIPAALAKKRDLLQQMAERLLHVDRHSAHRVEIDINLYSMTPLFSCSKIASRCLSSLTSFGAHLALMTISPCHLSTPLFVGPSRLLVTSALTT